MPDRAWLGEWPSAPALRRRAEAVLGLSLDARSADRLLEFLRVLERWAAKFNLVSVTSKDELVDRHLIDSLAVLDFVPETGTIADLGSGAGFPGLPIAVVRSGTRVILLESRAHRVSFLRQAVRSVDASNVEIFDGRAEDFPAREDLDVVVARAVRFADVVTFAASGLRHGGRLLTMGKSPLALAEQPGFRLERRRDYRLASGHAHSVVELARD